jgi:DNA-binding IclR family transcriptional regulator
MEHLSDHSNAIEKVLKVMMAFGPEAEEKGTLELSKALGMSKATVSRILNTLAGHGFLLKNPQSKKFQLGGWFISLGLSATRVLNKYLINIARPFVDELRDTLDETVTFSVLHGMDVFVSHIAEKPGIVSMAIRLGHIVPVNAAASAKAIFAFLPTDMTEKKIRENLPRFTPNTITDPKELKEHFKEIHMKGYAVDYEEMHVGLHSVSVPVLNNEKEPIAAVSVVGLPLGKNRGEYDTIIPQLRHTAGRISEQLFLMKQEF